MEEYKTKEMAEIIGLMCVGHAVSDIVPGKPGYVYFKNTVALEEDVKKFWNDELLVNPLDYESKKRTILSKLKR
jgi:hypothetical protein